MVFLFFSYHNDARSNKHQIHKTHLLVTIVSWINQVDTFKLYLNKSPGKFIHTNSQFMRGTRWRSL